MMHINFRHNRNLTSNLNPNLEGAEEIKITIRIRIKIETAKPQRIRQ